MIRAFVTTQLAVVLVALPATAYRWTHLGAAFGTPYWAGTTESLSRPLPVGEVMWLSIGNVPVRLHEAVTVTGIHVLVSPDVRELQTVRIAFASAGRGFSFLEDRYFTQYGFETDEDGAYVGTVLTPGEPTYFGAVQVSLARPGAYRVRGFRISYRDNSGRHGAQTVPVDYRFTVAAGGA